MRKLLRIGAVLLGVVGMLLCAAAIGIGWWAALRTIARLDGVAARLDGGLSKVEAQVARVEARVNAIRSDLNAARDAAEAIAGENPDLPKFRAQVERLLDRLIPTIDRAETIADSIQSAAASLRTAADIADQLNVAPEANVRIRNAADKIDRAAEMLNGLRAKVEALKLAKAVNLTRELVAVARQAIAGSEQLAEGLAAVRQVIVDVREGTAEARDQVVSWIYVAATAHTAVWLWGGLGQVCLIGWGRRRWPG